MDADAPAPCVARPSAAIILTGPLTSMRKDFNYLYHFNVEERTKPIFTMIYGTMSLGHNDLMAVNNAK